MLPNTAALQNDPHLNQHNLCAPAALFYSQAPVLFPDAAFPELVQTLINYLHPDNTQQLLSEVAEGLGIILARLARDKNLAIQGWQADCIMQQVSCPYWVCP